MSIDYGWEKLHGAVHSLCGHGDQTDRLVLALVNDLSHIDPENDIPKDLQGRFRDFMAHMTSVQPKGNEGSIQATIDTFDEIGISRSIEIIISLYDSVCRQVALSRN